MSKKSRRTSSTQNLFYLLILIAVLIIPLCFLEGLKDSDFNIFLLAFGSSNKLLKATFSFPLTLAIFLPLIGCIVGYILRARFLRGIIAITTFVISAILFFTLPSLVKIDVLNGFFQFSTEHLELGVGAIVNGVLCCLGALCGVAYTFIK